MKNKELENKAANSQVTRYRPLIIIADGQADDRRCAQQAKFEASVREAKSKKVTVSVQGWRTEAGDLWRINQLVQVKSAWMRIDAIMLVGGVNFTISDSGTITQLLLYPQNAFDVLPEIPPPTAKATSSKHKDVKKQDKKPAGNGSDKQGGTIGGKLSSNDFSHGL